MIAHVNLPRQVELLTDPSAARIVERQDADEFLVENVVLIWT